MKGYAHCAKCLIKREKKWINYQQYPDWINTFSVITHKSFHDVLAIS